MSVSKLIDKFAKRTALPVDVSEVEAELRARGINDEIYYWKDVDLPSEHMKGYITRWSYPESPGGAQKKCVDITYGYMPLGYERIVCGKELLHVLDPDNSKVQTEEELSRLISKIVLPPNVQDAFNDTAHVVTDRQAVIQALATLFPLAARNGLYQAYTEHSVSLTKIAEFAELPVAYVAIVMSKAWPDIHELILKV